LSLVLDTGPLLASFDRTDSRQAVCQSLIADTAEELVIPAPVLVEMDYWFHERLHPRILMPFLDDIDRGVYTVQALTAEDYRRVRELCEQYLDSDIGFVDASVVAIAERLNEDKIATLDHRHFSIIRPRHVNAFRLLPG
jgi:predicted nucleic acid-binding protein